MCKRSENSHGGRCASRNDLHSATQIWCLLVNQSIDQYRRLVIFAEQDQFRVVDVVHQRHGEFRRDTVKNVASPAAMSLDVDPRFRRKLFHNRRRMRGKDELHLAFFRNVEQFGHQASLCTRMQGRLDFVDDNQRAVRGGTKKIHQIGSGILACALVKVGVLPGAGVQDADLLILEGCHAAGRVRPVHNSRQEGPVCLVKWGYCGREICLCGCLSISNLRVDGLSAADIEEEDRTCETIRHASPTACPLAKRLRVNPCSSPDLIGERDALNFLPGRIWEKVVRIERMSGGLLCRIGCSGSL